MRILSFGHIPSWVGGRQDSGLANVIYQIAKNMSNSENVDMSLAATDVFIPKKRDGDLTIYGWTKGILVSYALSHIFLSLCWICQILIAKIKYGKIISIWGYFFKGLHLFRIINLTNPEAVHLHSMTACVYVKIIPRNIRVITTMHGIIGNDTTIPDQKYLFKMERDVCKSDRYYIIVFIAQDLIQQFKSIYGSINSPCKVILNAYDSNEFYYVNPRPHTCLTLATIASFSENKGQKRVIKAISQSGIKAKYICIGDSSSPKKEKEYINEAVENGVDFEYKGKKKPFEIRELLASVDYMILPSSTEGFGLVYLEAIACGVPVILPHHLPIVKETGIIKPMVNSVILDDSSVDSIVKILPHLNEYSFDHKDVANSIVEYSWENIAKEYIESFENNN